MASGAWARRAFPDLDGRAGLLLAATAAGRPRGVRPGTSRDQAPAGLGDAAPARRRLPEPALRQWPAPGRGSRARACRPRPGHWPAPGPPRQGPQAPVGLAAGLRPPRPPGLAAGAGLRAGPSLLGRAEERSVGPRPIRTAPEPERLSCLGDL